MIRKLVLAAAFAGVLGAPAIAPAFADDPKFSTETTILSDIWANEQAKAAFAKVFPDVVSNPQLEQAMSFTIMDIAGYAPDMFTEEKIKELQAEFDKIK